MNGNKRGKDLTEILLLAAMPIVALVVSIAVDYVRVDMTGESLKGRFWIDTFFNIMMMMSFFIPVRSIFKEHFKSKDRIVNKLKEYMVCSSNIYDGHQREFREWTAEEYAERKQRVIYKYINKLCLKNENGELIDRKMGFDFFIKEYAFDIDIIKSSTTLTKTQKRVAVEMIKEVEKTEQTTPEQVLPSIKATNERKRVKTDTERADRLNTSQKMLLFVGFAIVLSSIIPDLAQGASAKEILIKLGIRLAFGCWHSVSAILGAKKIISVVLFQELSEKITFMKEFFEARKLAIKEVSEETDIE